jgi:ribosome-binding factor A
MTSDRPRRVAEAIKEELADLIAREVKDPRVKEGLVTVTHVEVNRDLSVAVIGVSILVGDPMAVMTGLEKAAGFLRGPLARRLKLRISPELRFHHDRSQAFTGRLHEIVSEDERKRREADGEQETGDGQQETGDEQSGSESARE